MNDNIKGTWEEVFQRNEQAEGSLEEYNQIYPHRFEDGAQNRREAIEEELAHLGYLVTGKLGASTLVPIAEEE